MALAMVGMYTNQWSDDPDAAWQEAVRGAEAAMQADENEPAALLAMGIVRMLQSRLDEGRRHGDRLLELQPNKSEGLVLLGNIALSSGRPEEAIQHLETALRVDPMGPNICLHILGQALFMAGDTGRAEEMLLRRIEVSPETDSSRLLLASIYGHEDRFEEAQKYWADIFRVNPDYSLKDRVAAWPFLDDSFPKHIVAGLEKAGIDHQISFGDSPDTVT